ncbi:hypothetical protein D3C72_2441790 [compost metagenome]
MVAAVWIVRDEIRVFQFFDLCFVQWDANVFSEFYGGIEFPGRECFGRCGDGQNLIAELLLRAFEDECTVYASGKGNNYTAHAS